MIWLYACLKLLSIIASAFFAAFALLTKYKDDAGRITRSGKIALCGIVGTAAISGALYVLDVRAANEAARKAKTDADAAAQRLLTPLGPMRLRIRLRVPSAQFTAFRDRMVSQNSGWRQPYPMPLTDRDVPRNSTEEAKAYNFFSLIMIAVSVRGDKQSSPQRPPEFGKLWIFGWPTIEADGLPRPGGDPAQQDSRGTVHLFYDHASDSFLLESQTPYFDDFDTSGQFLSFRDFADKSLQLAFNVLERVAYAVDFAEIQSRNGKRRIWVENFKEESPGSDTFVAPILSKALLD